MKGKVVTVTIRRPHGAQPDHRITGVNRGSRLVRGKMCRDVGGQFIPVRQISSMKLA